MDALRGKEQFGIEKLADLLCKRIQGLPSEEAESRIKAMEAIAASVRAQSSKRAKPDPSPNPTPTQRVQIRA